MNTTSQNILESFHQLPEPEKREFADEITRWVAMQDFLPLTDEALADVADALFLEHDKTEAQDAETESRRSLAS